MSTPDLTPYEEIRQLRAPEEPGATDEFVNHDFEYLGRKLGMLVAEKNEAYGDSFAKSGDILRILYPSGVQPEQYGDLLAIARVLDKLFRIATKKDAFGETPWRDIAGYGLLGWAEEKNRER